MPACDNFKIRVLQYPEFHSWSDGAGQGTAQHTLALKPLPSWADILCSHAHFKWSPSWGRCFPGYLGILYWIFLFSPRDLETLAGLILLLLFPLSFDLIFNKKMLVSDLQALLNQAIRTQVLCGSFQNDFCIAIVSRKRRLKGMATWFHSCVQCWQTEAKSALLPYPTFRRVM